MKRQLKRICCLLTLVLTSTGAFVSVNRSSRVVPTSLSAKESKSLRVEESSSSSDEPQGLIRKFFSSSEKATPVPKQENENSGWSLGFLRRNNDNKNTLSETPQSEKRSSDDKKTEEKKRKQPKETKIQLKQSKDQSSSNEKTKKNPPKEKKQPKKEEKLESPSRPARSFISGLFVGGDDAANNDTKKKMNTQKEEKAEGVSARNFVSGLFSKDEDTSKKKNEEPDKTMSSVFGSVQRFFGGAFSDNNNKNNNQEQWVPVFPKTRLSPGEIVPATIGGIDLLVIASRDGRKLYCIANSCSHLGTPLETGKIVRLPVEGPMDKSEASRRRQSFTETEVSAILQQDGLEDCIVCPLHRTAFALKSGEVRGEWCPYPPLVGKLVGTVKQPTGVATFDIRTKGKQIEVRINSLLDERDDRWTNPS